MTQTHTKLDKEDYTYALKEIEKELEKANGWLKVAKQNCPESVIFVEIDMNKTAKNLVISAFYIEMVNVDDENTSQNTEDSTHTSK